MTDPRTAVLSAIERIDLDRPADESKTFEDLGADSLDMLDITMEVEEALLISLEPHDSDIGAEMTVAELIALVGRVAGEKPDDIVGHKTLSNELGELHHEPLRRDEAEMLIAACDAAREKRASDMPTEKDAIEALFAAQLRLRELGWCEAIYCPKDGSSFDAIEPGSTGIFRTHYSGEWPKGSWWAEDAGDLWPAHPILYRQTDEEKQRWAALKIQLSGSHA